MKRFKLNDRIRIVSMERVEDDDAVTAAQQMMPGRTGTVVRLLRRDISAWVRMDTDLPAALASFPSDDMRGRNILLWPDECELENAPKTHLTNNDEP